MSGFKKYLVYFFWVLSTGCLLYLSLGYHDSASSILAQVEPQRYAVSFQKPVRVKEIYVIPGQRVSKGDKLVTVERQDLLFDVDRKKFSLENHKSRLEVLESERQYKLSMAKLNYDQRMMKIESDLKRIQLIVASNSDISNSLKALNLLSDSVNIANRSDLDLRINLLKNEKQSLTTQYYLEVKGVGHTYTLDTTILQREIRQVQEEIALLKREESELTQFAKKDGTIGNVYTETEELAQPYTTLISVYDNNPTVIRALMNEHHNVTLTSGDKVIVESTNRKYKIKGELIEVGSRIIEYPNRLRTFQEVTVYGRELFIKIPVESSFLNGEKVFVRLE